MYIVYTHPADGYPRARRCNTYREAGRVLQALQEANADPIPMDLQDLFNAETSVLPLIVDHSDSEASELMLQRSHPVEDDAITI